MKPTWGLNLPIQELVVFLTAHALRDNHKFIGTYPKKNTTKTTETFCTNCTIKFVCSQRK